MALTSKLRLNQMAEGLGLLDGSLENMLDTANGSYTAEVLPTEATGTLEETLQKLAKSMQRRFGTTSAGAFNETFGAANAIGEIAAFSEDDNQDVLISNNANKEFKIELGSGFDTQLLMDRVASQEKVILKSNTDYELLLDESNTKTSLKADGSILDMSKGAATGQGIIDLTTGTNHILKIDGSANAQKITLESIKDMVIDWGVGENFQMYTAAGGEYVHEIDDDASVTRTDVFGGTNVAGRFSQLKAGNYDYERDINQDNAQIDKNLDYRFSIDTGANHQARIMAGSLASDAVGKLAKNTSGAQTESGVGVQVAAQQLNGEQHVAIAAHGVESGPSQADADFSKLTVNTSSIVMETVGIWSEESEGTKIHAIKGALNASLPTSYGGSNALIDARVGGNPLGDANHIWFRDSHCDVGTGGDQWSEARGIPLSVAKKEWEDYEATFGEVSLMNALVAAASGGTTDAGQYIIALDASVPAGNLLLATSGTASDVFESDGARFAAFDFNSKDTAPGADLTQAADKISEIPSSGLDADEILSAVKVFVNGQLLVGGLASGSPVGQNIDYHICDHDHDTATAYNGSAFSLKFAFELVQGDIIQIFVG